MSSTCPILKVIDCDGEEEQREKREERLPINSIQSSPVPVEDVETAEEAILFEQEGEKLDECKLEENIKSDFPLKTERRRSSLSWKGMKKQLNRVDMKLKHTFSAPEKNSSGKKNLGLNSSPVLVSPAEMDSGENSPELLNSPDSDELPAIVVIKEQEGVGESAGGLHPADLRLFNSQSNPGAPPRRDKHSVTVDQKTPNHRSATRLLSVPNIKYSNQQAHQKDGTKQTNQNNQAFGNIIRKISKLLNNFALSS